MKILILIFLVSSSVFASDLILIQVTNDDVFNYFFSIFFNISLVLVPVFGAISLAKV